MKKYRLVLLFLIVLILTVLNKVAANNISVSNADLTGLDITNGFVMVQFDLSWENSWNETSGPTSNFDAAWIFVKYSTDGGVSWNHAYLNNTGNSPGTGTSAAIQVGLLDESSAFNASTNPAMGAFIYRTDVGGSGTTAVSNARLRWNFEANTNNPLTGTEPIDIKVFAIEMVNIPEGSYLAGGGTGDGEIVAAGTTDEYQVNSENALTVGVAGDLFYDTSDPNTGDAGGALPATFPKGFGEFFLMKYEMTQQQYVDFLNTLSYDQQATRTGQSPSSADGTRVMGTSNRNMVQIAVPGVNSGTPAVYETDNPFVAMNFLSWMDAAAYTDWAGLRPFTEMEYEKACVGTTLLTGQGRLTAGGFRATASGFSGSRYVISNAGLANENIIAEYDPDVNLLIARKLPLSGNIPFRVGIFAANPANTGRGTSGATYYGVMEMSGNVMEQVVHIGSSTSRAYAGTHGDGRLSDNGNASDQNQGSAVSATTTDWPGYSSGTLTNEVDDAAGSGPKGGSFDTSLSEGGGEIAARLEITVGFSSRIRDVGYRCARSAPSSVPEN